MSALPAVVSVQGAWVTRATGPFGPSDLDPDDIRDVACDVTASDNQCRPPDEPEPPQVPDDVPDVGGLGALAQLFVLLLVIVLAALLVWLAVRYFGGFGQRTRHDSDDDSDLDEAIDEAVDARVVDDETPPDRWRRRAEEHRAAGDFRESVRCEYRALVGDLARAGHVDEIAGRTSGEERAQIAELAPGLGERGRDVARQFDLAADIFDEAWFDDGVVTADDDSRFVAASHAVLDVVLASALQRRVGGRRS